MSGDLDRELWELAAEVCTPAELEALQLHERLGYRRIAVVLGITFDAARDRVRRAEAKVRRELTERAASGSR